MNVNAVGPADQVTKSLRGALLNLLACLFAPWIALWVCLENAICRVRKYMLLYSIHFGVRHFGLTETQLNLTRRQRALLKRRPDQELQRALNECTAAELTHIVAVNATFWSAFRSVWRQSNPSSQH